MAVRGDWTPNEVLKADDLNDTFASKLDLAGVIVKQMRFDADSGDRTTTSTSFADVSGLTQTITPEFDTTRILIIVTGQWRTEINPALTGVAQGNFQITLDDNTQINGASNIAVGITETSANVQTVSGPLILWGFHDPGVTTTQTYKVRFKSANANCTTSLLGSSFSRSHMYLFEVKL